ncbi:hypothetical protein AF332_07015 [Sporosarcina globispora]|uniref:Uncharacterized protein n=1 Tax=Sporosarcina globispora TaxID=1459 RepID=A0A0M0GAP2_SPOGL|nr:hypothetical protein [Sporosarcina globispora]KON86592.1 hypothetical protein AF332_07015 [Sporosarcina globispora]
MQQLSIFDVFEDMEKDIKLQDIVNKSLITVDGIKVDNSKIVAVYVPDAPNDEAAVATLESGLYKHYRFVHGHLYESTLFEKWEPGYYWTWLTKE